MVTHYTKWGPAVATRRTAVVESTGLWRVDGRGGCECARTSLTLVFFVVPSVHSKKHLFGCRLEVMFLFRLHTRTYVRYIP